MTRKEINAHPFVKWAKSRRIYSAWKRNIVMEEKVALSLMPRIISSTFFWRGSREGQEYWEKLHWEWQKEINYES